MACKSVVYGQGQCYCLLFFITPFCHSLCPVNILIFLPKATIICHFFFEFKLLKNMYFLYIESLLWAKQSALSVWMPSMVLRHAPLECERLVYDCTLHLFACFFI